MREDKKQLGFCTERLILRGIGAEDAQKICAWRSDPATYRYFTTPKPLSCSEYLAWFCGPYQQDSTRWEWMIVRKSDEKKLGTMGISHLDVCGHVAEVGYLLAHEFRGQGYAKEAVEALCHFVKTQWGILRMRAVIHDKNNASQHFVCRLGFLPLRQEGSFTVWEKEL